MRLQAVYQARCKRPLSKASRKNFAAAPLPVLRRCASCAPGRLAVGRWCPGRWFGEAVPSLHDCLGHVRRVKARPLRGRCASLDTSATARGMAAIEGTGEKKSTASVQVSHGRSCH
jgi:hypothetical protein